MPGRYAIGIDLGGTNIKGGIIDARRRLLVSDSVATEADRGVEHVFKRMVALAERLMKRRRLRRSDMVGIGVGAPGPMSHAKGLIYFAPNLPGWQNVPLRDMFHDATGVPVTLENDANSAAFGEFVAGAGRKVRSLIMLTLGTGLGGGVVLDDRLRRGEFDNAGEIGHTIVVPNGRPCPCGQRGCLERYSSANAVGERLVEAVQAGAPSSLAPRVAAGKPVTSRDVLAAMNAGDELAARIWDETCFYLGVACVNLQHAFNVPLVVLAGGLIHAGRKLLAPITQHFRLQSWRIAKDHPRIAFAELGTDAGLIGAAALAQEQAGG